MTPHLNIQVTSLVLKSSVDSQQHVCISHHFREFMNDKTYYHIRTFCAQKPSKGSNSSKTTSNDKLLAILIPSGHLRQNKKGSHGYVMDQDLMLKLLYLCCRGVDTVLFLSFV